METRRSFTKRERILVAATGVVLAGFLLYLLVFIPLRNRQAEDTPRDPQQFSVPEMEAMLDRADELGKNVQALKERLGNRKGRIAEEREIISVLTHIESVAGKSGLGFGTYNPSPVNFSAPVPYLDIHLSGGGKYPAVVKFLYNVEHADYFMQVTSLRMSGGKDLKVEADVRVYVSRADRVRKTRRSRRVL